MHINHIFGNQRTSIEEITEHLFISGLGYPIIILKQLMRANAIFYDWGIRSNHDLADIIVGLLHSIETLLGQLLIRGKKSFPLSDGVEVEIEANMKGLINTKDKLE